MDTAPFPVFLQPSGVCAYVIVGNEVCCRRTLAEARVGLGDGAGGAGGGSSGAGAGGARGAGRGAQDCGWARAGVWARGGAAGRKQVCKKKCEGMEKEEEVSATEEPKKKKKGQKKKPTARAKACSFGLGKAGQRNQAGNYTLVVLLWLSLSLPGYFVLEVVALAQAQHSLASSQCCRWLQERHGHPMHGREN